MGNRVLSLLVALAVALVAIPLAMPGRAAGQGAHCPAIGIVPGSVSVISTSDGAGEVSGHTVRFQLCGSTKSPTVTAGAQPPPKIGLLWEAGDRYNRWTGEQNGFLLNNPAEAGITLSAVDLAKIWKGRKEISDSAAPDRLHHVYATDSSHGYGFRNFQGVTAEFGPADLLDYLAASGDLPLTLQFNVPAAAGMANPVNLGEYDWLVVLYQDFANSCEAEFSAATSTIVPAYMPGELQLFPKVVEPGSILTVVGSGFPVLAPVRLARIGPFTLPWFPPIVFIADPVTASDQLGTFDFEIVPPVFDIGPVPIEVEVGAKTVAAEFIMTDDGSYGPSPIYYTQWHILEEMGDNFVRAFYYDDASCRWTFYDPDIPEESSLTRFHGGETYWILVKEPAEVVLDRTTRYLTCTEDGNCWNQVVW